MKAEIGTDHQHGRYVRVTIGDGIGFVRSTTVYADDPCHKAREDKIARLEDQLERTQGYEARMANRLAQIERQVQIWEWQLEKCDEITLRACVNQLRAIIDAPDAGGEDT